MKTQSISFKALFKRLLLLFTSFDEYGRYDMPALINKVLGVTGREKLLYIGFSSGKSFN